MDTFDATLAIVEDFFNKDHCLQGFLVFFPQTKSIIANPYNTKKEEPLFEEFLKRYCIENKIDHFYIASEAWSAKRTPETYDPTISISEAPDREEILIVTLITKNGDTIASASIIGNQPPARFLGNWKKMTKGNAISRWDACLIYN